MDDISDYKHLYSNKYLSKKRIKLSAWYYPGEWLQYFDLLVSIVFENEIYKRGMYEWKYVPLGFREYLEKIDPCQEVIWNQCSQYTDCYSHYPILFKTPDGLKKWEDIDWIGMAAEQDRKIHGWTGLVKN